jgi:peptidoglycan/xylan/chitin deacetylase (PgdA/CDA1 family)
MVGKRALLAKAIYTVGLPSILGRMPPRNGLLVLNHHRIGNSAEDPYDPGLFSATADQLDQQLTTIKRYATPVTLEEAIEFCEGRDRAPRCRVLVTFDDGYLDNYTAAFPVLRSHGVQGVFFLATDLVGSSATPWWDDIAYRLRRTTNRKLTFRYPRELQVDMDALGLEKALNLVLDLYKSLDNHDPQRFFEHLAEQTGVDGPPTSVRRFLNWDEAREMIRCGMAIGSHTHSHTVLSQLSEEQQRDELTTPRAILKHQLGIDATTLAYPVGLPHCFSAATQRIAREIGYRVAFSFYGGTNFHGASNPFDVRRISAGHEGVQRFRVQTAICRVSGRFWP